MRLYFTEFAPSARAGVRPLQFVSVVGAILTSSVLHVLCNVPVAMAALWCLLMAASEALISVINHLFLVRRPPDGDLRTWANAKTVLAGVGGVVVSLGQVLLAVPGEPLTAFVPSWGILMWCCGAVWAGAFYAPALYTMIVSSTLPAAFYLLPQGDIERATGLCLLAVVPFCMLIGRQASMRYRAAVNDKLEIAQLLKTQNAHLQRIRLLSDERNRFFSAASHDLRQPLHAMGLYISLLRDAPHAAEREDLLQSLAQCAQILDTQFNAIIGVNETDDLLEHAGPAPTPLQAVFDRVAAQVRPSAARAGLRLRLMKTGAWATIAPDILDRVLTNLVANALRHTEQGGVLLGARRRRERIEIHVIDTGVGIADEHREAVFRDFFQVGNPERNPERGFGLGLGIVRRLCEGMDWPIRMSSRLGHGAAFVVSVPAARAPARAAPSRQQASVTPEPANAALRIRDTLVVDDDRQVLDAMKRILARWEVRAMFCETAEDALRVLEASDPITGWNVLIDHRLPGDLDGLALADRIRVLYGPRVLPAIITGEADEALEAAADQRGVVILRKPVQPVRLRALLAR
jgi:two-component system, sensor histidine kinase